MAGLPSAPFPSWFPAMRLGIVVAVAFSLLVVALLDRRRGWGRRRRSRLLLGIPWGTIVTILLVLSVYLFVQGGFGHWFNPVTVAYRSWSYLYPLGMVVAPFAHNGVGHLTGNLIGTAALGSLAEYAWGHFPEERGTTTFSSPRTNPYVRAFLVFPGIAVVLGLLTGLLSWGPVIGFSGVVFAYAGFALVRHPLLTVVALSADDVLRVVYRGLRDPVVIAQAEPGFSKPWWAGIAVQGHLLGLLLGLLAGAVLVRHGDDFDATRLWAGALIVATSLSLWALWWFRGNAEFVLFRGPGVVFVLAIALFVTLAFDLRRRDTAILDVPSRQVGALVILVPILALGIAAVPINLATVADAGPPGDDPGVSVRDYTVTYAENVTNRMTSVVNVSFLGETTRVRASGVIVVSQERHIWTTAVPASRLAFTGTVRVPVGGPGWRETVVVRRRGWSAAGGPSAYRVWIKPEGGEFRLAFLSDPAPADPVLSGKNVTLRPTVEGVAIELSRNGTALASVPIPGENDTATAAGITFVRDGKRVIATYNDTRIGVARKESYHSR